MEMYIACRVGEESELQKGCGAPSVMQKEDVRAKERTPDSSAVVQLLSRYLALTCLLAA